MLIYLLRRAGLALLFVLLVSSLALLIVQLAPGDYAADLFGIGADPALVAAARTTYGLDRPILEQYAVWLGHALRLDFGSSLLYRRPVMDLVVQRAANTAILALAALVIATIVGLPVGVLAGSRRSSGAAAMVRGASILFFSVPPMLLSLFFVLVAARTGWLPVGGMTSGDSGSGIGDSGSGIGDSGSGIGDLGLGIGGSSWWIWGLGVGDWGFAIGDWIAWARDVAWHLPVPTLALALPVGAMLERLLAQSMAETIRAPFIVAAESRGVSRSRIIWRHALRVALQPIVSIYGLIIGTLLSGSFMVEIITAWPGLGRLTYDALRGRDVYLVAGCAAAGALFLAMGSMISDVLHAALDPRVRERG